MNLVMRVSDQVVALDFGRVIANGRPEEVQVQSRGRARLSRERRLERGDSRGKGLEACYGPVRALHGSTSRSRTAASTAVLGANGAGKTTILSALCGMIRRSGDIRFRGRPIGALATEDVARLGVAHVPDGRGTFIDLTVEENLRLGAYVRSDRQGVRKDFDRVFGYFPRLKERRRQQAGTLSGGEQQMLAIVARADDAARACCCSTSPRSASRRWWSRKSFASSARSIATRASSMLIVEQNAIARARSRRPRLSHRDRTGRVQRPSSGFAPTKRCAASISATRGEREIGRVPPSGASGVAIGGIYASVALALVMIYQATQLMNFAQGEMAMFSTYFAWKMIESGAPYWFAFFATVAVSFIVGVAIERLIVRPFDDAPVLTW